MIIPKIHFKVGDRVAHKDGSIGHVENELGDNDDIMTDVRWLTPNNEPSCCIGCCFNDNLRKVPDSVVPMQRSKEWWAEAKEFHKMIENALSMAEI